jgi:hypothetical protein
VALQTPKSKYVKSAAMASLEKGPYMDIPYLNGAFGCAMYVYYGGRKDALLL